MAVTLRGVPSRDRIEVTGDIQISLKLPLAEAGLFYLASSDGTLIEGSYQEEKGYRFRLHTEGAALTAIRREGDHDIVELGWSMEWVTVASQQECGYLTHKEEAFPVLPGLFEGVERLKEPAH